MTMFEKPLTHSRYAAFVLDGVPEGIGHPLTLAALGLAGEGGEVVDLVKKHLYHDEANVTREKFVEEIGDTFWYLTLLMLTQGISLEEVMMKNMKKLVKRYPDRHPELARLWHDAELEQLDAHPKG